MNHVRVGQVLRPVPFQRQRRDVRAEENPEQKKSSTVRPSRFALRSWPPRRRLGTVRSHQLPGRYCGLLPRRPFSQASRMAGVVLLCCGQDGHRVVVLSRTAYHTRRGCVNQGNMRVETLNLHVALVLRSVFLQNIFQFSLDEKARR